MLALEAVEKSFAGIPVLRRLTLALARGETAILIGPSGCGKSTVLRLLLGLLRPDGGRVLFDGEPLRADSLRKIRHRCGYVIQEGGLFPHLTARENITLPIHRLGWDPSRIAARIGELIALTRFPGDGLDRYPVELSGGQRQRVALMRALAVDPDVLLLDEPLGALDPMVRYELQGDLRRIFETLGKTTLLVTHDLAEAAWFGRRIILMREGRIVQQGSLRDLHDHPADPFVTQFLRAQRAGEASGETGR